MDNSKRTGPRLGLSAAEAIAKIFAAHGVTPHVVIDPSKPPHFDAKTSVVTLPALPTHDLTEEEQAQLRAYFFHEVQGEQQVRTWDNNHPALQGSKQRQRLANGIGDAFLDTAILEDRPGAGIDIRQSLAADWQALKTKGTTPSVGLASAVCRYILEGVATWQEIRQGLSNCHELWDHMEPAIPDGTRVHSEAEVMSLTKAVDKALNAYRGEDDDEDEDGDPDADQRGGGSGSGNGKGRGKPGTSGQPGSQPGNQPGSSSGESGSNNGDSESGEADSGEAEVAGSGEATEKQSSGAGGSARGGNSAGADPNAAAKQKQSPPKSEVKRQLADGKDSEDTMAESLSKMLKGSGGSKSGSSSRTFDERFRAVVEPKHLDAWMAQQGKAGREGPSADAKRDGSALANRLRSALAGPTMRVERQQEYGRFDARRAALALAGNRHVYSRQREIPGDDVAVSVAWDESSSMTGQPIAGVKKLVSALAACFQQMPNVKVEFTGWTSGNTADEWPSELKAKRLTEQREADSARRQSGAATHTAGDSSVHRIYKSFEEGPTAIFPRLRLIAGRGGTPMCEGFAFSAKRLAARKERRKVMFFLTDGEASHNDVAENAPWGYNALAYEVERATASGVDVVVVKLLESGNADYYRGQISGWEQILKGSNEQLRNAGHDRKHLESLKAQYEAHIKTVTFRGVVKEADKGFGAFATVLAVDSSNVMQPILNLLAGILTHKTRSKA